MGNTPIRYRECCAIDVHPIRMLGHSAIPCYRVEFLPKFRDRKRDVECRPFSALGRLEEPDGRPAVGSWTIPTVGYLMELLAPQAAPHRRPHVASRAG